MNGLLIFDHLNDILFTKCNRKFALHIENLAKTQGLIGSDDNVEDKYDGDLKSDDEDEDDGDDDDKFKQLNPNILMQIFSPLITSQQVMASQFGNCYTSIKCNDDINIVFDDFMGYTFLYIAFEGLDLMKKTLGMCVAVVDHVCGPDVADLKYNKNKANMVSSLLDSWRELRESEQSILTETVEQLSVNPDLASSTLKILHDAVDKLKMQSDFPNVHALVLVDHKFLSLYSSKNAQDLSAADISLMILLCHIINKKKKKSSVELNNSEDETSNILLFSNQPSSEEVDQQLNLETKLANPTSEDINNLFSGSRESSVSQDLCCLAEDGLNSQLILLGPEKSRTVNVIHIFELSPGINFIAIMEVTSVLISSGLYDSFYHLNIMNSLQLQRDIDELRSAFEYLDGSIKKTVDGIKKHRSHINNDIDMCQRRLQLKWEFLRRKYLDLIKLRDPEAILQIESNMPGFTDTMKELLRLTCFDKHFLKSSNDVVLTVGRLVRQKFNDFNDFLKAKALKNFTLGSFIITRTSLTINKYLEEFPGLVHFIYIDRTTHRLTTPTLDFTNSETLTLTKKKIWLMVNQSRMHLQEGHFSVMWKDTTFNYAYFLWFEDDSGTPLKCKTYLSHQMNNLPLPGIFCGDYYKKLVQACFPKKSYNKIRIYELYCVHLGITTSSCVLEHSRRLTSTISEIIGLPNNPTDIL